MPDLRKWWTPALIFFLAMGHSVSAESQRISEYQVKAAYLYNFARFVEWPQELFSDKTQPLIIGLLGVDPFGEILETTIREKTINGRRLKVRRFHRTADAVACHLLFVGRSEENHAEEILAKLKRFGILTVSEIESFAHVGGIIGFMLIDDRVRFEINTRAANDVGLSISSKLLSVARVVEDEKSKKAGKVR